MFKSEMSSLDIMQITYQYSNSMRKWSAKSLCGGSVIISYSEASILFKSYVNLKSLRCPVLPANASASPNSQDFCVWYPHLFVRLNILLFLE